MSKSELTKLFNSPVKEVQAVSKPLASDGKGAVASIVGAKHSGNLVTLQNGDKYIIHKNPMSKPFFKNDTVITSAIAKDWKPVGEPHKPQNTTVRDMMNNGSYNVVSSNCNHATAKSNPNVETTALGRDITPKKNERCRSSFQGRR
jgi:hypothetical protein